MLQNGTIGRGKKTGRPVYSCSSDTGTLLVSVHDANKAEVDGIEIKILETGQTTRTTSTLPAKFTNLASGKYTICLCSDLESKWLRQSGRFPSLTQRCTVRSGKVTVARFVVKQMPHPRISVAPESKDFSAVKTGSDAETQVFTVTNLGDESLTINAVYITPDNGPFAISQSLDTSTPIPPGGIRTLQVTCTPQSADEVSGALRIDSNAANIPQWNGELNTAYFNLLSLTMPEYLAPEFETVRVNFELDGPTDNVALHVEVRDKRGGRAILTRPLSVLEKEERFFEWDGRLDPHNDYPDEFVTVQYSPYTLKLIAHDPVVGTKSGEVVFKVEVKELTLNLGLVEESSNETDTVTMLGDCNESRPFRGRDEVNGKLVTKYAGGFTEKIETTLNDYAKRLRAGFDAIPEKFPDTVDESISTRRAPAISALLNTATYWRASLAKNQSDGRDFARARVNNNVTGWYGTPLRERLSTRGRYDVYNDVLVNNLENKAQHRVKVFPNVYAVTPYVRNYKCYRVRHIRYTRKQYKAAMVSLEHTLKVGLTSQNRQEVIHCAARILYDINHLTVTHRGQGAVAELMGLSVLAARGIAIPPLVSEGKPIWPWAEGALATRKRFTKSFEGWVETGIWDFWYENNEYEPHPRPDLRDEPAIPLSVIVKIRSSTDGAELAPKALGNARVLWDWEEIAEVAGSESERANSSGRDASPSDREPPRKSVFGWGSRVLQDFFNPSEELPVFSGGGKDFPYTVSQAKRRTRAAFSEFRWNGEEAGKSGVLFRPMRVEGEEFVIHAYLDVDGSLDVNGELDTPQSDSIDISYPLGA